MKGLIYVFITAILLFVLAGCVSEPSHAGVPVRVYTLAEPESHGALDEIILYCPEGEDIPLFALKAALSGGGRSPALAEVLSFSSDGGVAAVLLSGEASALTGYSLTLARACIVLTLTGLDGIDGVEITVEGEETVRLGASDFIPGALVLEGTEHSVTLYFADETGEHAVPDTRTLVVRETDTVNWYLHYMLEEMIAGPQKEGLLPVLPEGTRLLSVFMTEGGVCGVNFSGEFVSGAGTGGVSPFQTLYCLVRSVTAQPGVSSLRLLVEGQALESYGGIDTTEPLTAAELSK